MKIVEEKLIINKKKLRGEEGYSTFSERIKEDTIEKEMPFPKRKPRRLSGYDYSAPGVYFVTVCTKERKQILSHIIVGQGLAPAENRLTQYGAIIKEQLEETEKRYECVSIDKYVIMPNLLHALITILPKTAGASPCPTISDVVCSFKSISTILCRKAGFEERQLFQGSFHDHIIRGEKDYEKIWEYIDTNVIRWENDCFYN